MEEEVWVAIDERTSRIISFGDQSSVKLSANTHEKLSGNKVKLRMLKVGMILYEE